MNPANPTVSANVSRLREVLNARIEILHPIEHRCIRGSHGESGEMYQWFLEVGGYKPVGMEDDPKAFNTYELHAAVSSGDEGLIFSLHLEHNVYEAGVEDQHLFDQLNPDTLTEFQTVAQSWEIPVEDIERGKALLMTLIESIGPVLADLGLDLEPEPQAA